MKRSLESPQPKEAKRLKPCPEISAVTVTSSEWRGGEFQLITWTSRGDVPAVMIRLCESLEHAWGEDLHDGWLGIANTGSSIVSVPRGSFPGVFYVRVESAASRSVYSYSGPITLNRDCVRPKILDVVCACTEWAGGTVQSVTWSHQGDVPNVQLRLCKATAQGGIDPIEYGSELHWDIANTNSSSFMVPVGLIPGGYHVRVESVACRRSHAFSGLIQVDQGGTPPAILDVATDSADWEGGQRQEITWSYEGHVPTVTVGLYVSDSERSIFFDELVDVLDLEIPNSGSSLITVPSGLPPGSYRIRVEASHSSRVSAFSPDIRIDQGRTPPAISDVTASQRIWHSGSQQAITWSSQGEVPHVSVSLCTKNTAFLLREEIVECFCWKLANTGSCSVTVPSGLPPGAYSVLIESNSSRRIKASSADILVDDDHRERCVQYALGLLGLRRPRRLPYSVVKKIAVMAAT